MGSSLKTYLAFVIIDTGLALLYHQLMKRKLESKEIDKIIQEQVEIEDELRDDIREMGKTQEEVDKTINFIYNNVELVQIMIIIMPVINIATFIGLMTNIIGVIES